MKFATTREGETLSQLVKRLYCPNSESELREISKLFREANPALKSAKRLAVGSLVKVPPIKGKDVSDDVQSPQLMASSLLQIVRDQLAELPEVFSQIAEQQESEIQASFDLAKSKKVQSLARRDKVAKERIADVTKAGKVRLKELKDRKALHDTAVKEIDADLDDLIRMVASVKDR